MTEAVKALHALSKRKVVVLAPSSKAVEVLKDEGFTKSQTFQRFQADPMIRNFTEGSIIWVHEAGFMSSEQMRWLLDHATQTDSRVILSGDTLQHHSVERGDALRVLEKTGAVRSIASRYQNCSTPLRTFQTETRWLAGRSWTISVQSRNSRERKPELTRSPDCISRLLNAVKARLLSLPHTRKGAQ
jgi:ATP-dependent exoDNAse (exonuclease V) alpha subunit